MRGICQLGRQLPASYLFSKLIRPYTSRRFSKAELLPAFFVADHFNGQGHFLSQQVASARDICLVEVHIGAESFMKTTSIFLSSACVISRMFRKIFQVQ